MRITLTSKTVNNGVVTGNVPDDGGTIFFLLIEGTLRRDLNQEFKERLYQVAFVVIVLFFVFIMFNDVAKLNLLPKLKL